MKITYNSLGGFERQRDSKDEKLKWIAMDLAGCKITDFKITEALDEQKEHFLELYKEAVAEDEAMSKRMKDRELFLDEKIDLSNPQQLDDDRYRQSFKRAHSNAKSRQLWKRFSAAELTQEKEELRRVAEELDLDTKHLEREFDYALQGALEVLSDADWSNMTNTESQGEWTKEKATEHINAEGGNSQTLFYALENGKFLPPPIVLFRDDEPPYLVSGDAQLLACNALGRKPLILAVHV